MVSPPPVRSARPCTQRHGRAPGRGFTLLELIVVVVILAAASGVAVTTYSGVVDRSHDAAARTSLAAVLRDAQALAAFESPAAVDLAHLEAALADVEAHAPALTAAPVGLHATGPVFALTPSGGQDPSLAYGQVSAALSEDASGATPGRVALAMRSRSGSCALARAVRSSGSAVQAWSVAVTDCAATLAEAGPPTTDTTSPSTLPEQSTTTTVPAAATSTTVPSTTTTTAPACTAPDEVLAAGGTHQVGVPVGCTAATVILAGASGGGRSGGEGTYGRGGLGGWGQVSFPVAPGEILDVVVGSRGEDHRSILSGSAALAGGFGGGGDGGAAVLAQGGGGGGGRSAVVRAGQVLAAVGGGGGAGGTLLTDTMVTGSGGHGGGPGAAGTAGTAASGLAPGLGGGAGTPSSGGAAAFSSAATCGSADVVQAGPGTSGAGGDGASSSSALDLTSTQTGGGGGGGHWGGGGGGCSLRYGAGGGGGGGGGFAAPGVTVHQSLTGVHAGDGQVTIAWD